jgi:hypothetical protein
MQLTISSRRDIAVLQKESSSLEDEEDVKRHYSVSVAVSEIIDTPGEPTTSNTRS